MAQSEASVVGGLAQLARAPALQAGGHRFESDILHQEERSVGLEHPDLNRRVIGSESDILHQGERRFTSRVGLKL